MERGSYRLRGIEADRHPALAGDIETDVAIVGGGIRGLRAALLLQPAGRRVAVLEARRVGRQVSGHATARITALHGLIYLHAAQRWVRGRRAGPHASLDRLGPDEAMVAEIDGGKVAACRDPDGRLRLRSAICTHMGCVASWNGVARTWDCACHGARFEVDGRVVSGPATRALPAARPPQGGTG